VNSRRVVRLPTEDNVSLITFAMCGRAFSCNKVTLCVFFLAIIGRFWFKARFKSINV